MFLFLNSNNNNIFLNIFSRYLRQQCLNYRFLYDDSIPISRMVTDLGNKMQTCTQRYDRRPYGVGLLIAGYDVRINNFYIDYV